MSTVKTGRGYVYSIQYHIVWCVKYRRKILIGEFEQSLKEILLKIANDNNFKIVEMETDKDHIHLLIECSPQHQIQIVTVFSCRLQGKRANKAKKMIKELIEDDTCEES